MKTVSVIVPVYNVEEYLPACVESVIGQTYADRTELILVNDGSTDGSGRICEDYRRSNPGIILINQANSGLSEARNAGMAVATGDYVFFLDADDRLAPDALQVLVDYALQNSCDLVQGGFYYAYEDHLLRDTKPQAAVLNKAEAMKALVRNDVVKNFAWGKLYRADLVRGIPFTQGVYFEDSYWQHHVVNRVSRYGIVPSPLYYYRQRKDGISSAISLRQLDLLRGYDERLLFVQDNYPALTDEMLRAFWHICYVLWRGSRTASTEVREAYDEAVPHYLQTRFQPHAGALSRVVSYQLFRHAPHLLPLHDLMRRALDRVAGRRYVSVPTDSHSDR